MKLNPSGNAFVFAKKSFIYLMSLIFLVGCQPTNFEALQKSADLSSQSNTNNNSQGQNNGNNNSGNNNGNGGNAGGSNLPPTSSGGSGGAWGAGTAGRSPNGAIIYIPKNYGSNAIGSSVLILFNSYFNYWTAWANKKAGQIKVGLHFVTCDVTLLSRVIIEPGAELRFDDAWSFSSTAGMKALGTAGNPISFTVSTNSPQLSWQSLEIGTDSKPVLNASYENEFSMNYLKYVVFSTRSGTMASASTTLSNAFLDSVTITIPTHKEKLSNSTAWRSLIGSNVSTEYSNIFNSSGGGTISVGSGTMLLWNSNLSSSFTTYYSAPSLVAYNTMPAITCASTTTAIKSQLVYGNVYTTNNCSNVITGSDNTSSGTTMTSLPLLFNIGTNRIIAKMNQELPIVRVFAIDKQGFIANPSLHWQATYTLDGTTYNHSSTWDTDDTPVISIGTSEYYSLSVTSLNGQSYLGSVLINVLVSRN